ncbi:MAG: PH domain-containing protein [Pirellulales bacterium]
MHEREQLLWAGKPPDGILFRPIDLLLVPFSLMWGGFAIFWELTVINAKAPLFFKFWGMPFVLIGLYLIFGRFFVDAWQRAKTFYGVTSERILIRSGLWNRTTQSLNLKSLPEIVLSERSSGGGTITFGPSNIFSQMQNPGAGWPSWGPKPTAIELAVDARQVYQIICEARRKEQ